jgi:tetratricopeptide (TPR) repeat protein
MKSFFTLVLALLSISLVHAEFAQLVESGDVHDAKFECDEALKFYLPAEKLDPKNVGLLVKISRQYALRMNDLPKEADKIASGRKALSYAERAVTLAPNECDPHLSVAICLGKLTPFAGAREKVENSSKIKTAAEKAVKLNPKNDLAWHLLGRWHQELANIGGVTRALASAIYGGLPAASNEEAVKCFQKAMALNAKRLVHVVELGRTYQMMGRDAEAKRFLQAGLAMPNKDKDDPATKVRGQATLKELLGSSLNFVGKIFTPRAAGLKLGMPNRSSGNPVSQTGAYFSSIEARFSTTMFGRFLSKLDSIKTLPWILIVFPISGVRLS